MKRFVAPSGIVFLVAAVLSSCANEAPAKMDYTVEAVPLTQVDITDEFWAPKQEVNRTVSIQHSIAKSEERSGALNIRGGYLEGAGYMIMKRRDPDFMQYVKTRVDATVERSLAAAEKAGVRGRGGASPESAISYFEATGDRRLLDMAIQSSDEAAETYGPGKKSYISGHEGQKIGLIKLFRFTGDDKYWKLAKFLLDIRGREEHQDQSAREYPGDREYNQNHMPVLEQDEAVGHAVRAMYLYIPLTDIAALTGQPEYAQAVDKIWENVVGKKMYISGGVGSIRQQEKFGPNYHLPNVSSWHETCASYGNAVWNHRLFLLHKDAKYIDTMERILYNGWLAGVSLIGNRFFYQNVLMSYGNYERFDWINVPCCPPNVVRLMASLGSYIYAQTENEIYVNLYAGSNAQVKLAKNNVKITQETRYPWDGNINITIAPERVSKFSILIRIPEWALQKPLPSDLYRYMKTADEKPTLNVNGIPVELKLEKGYVRLNRKWKANDVIQLNIPMPVHQVLSHDRVLDNRGRVALERGPILFCAEWPDNGGSALNIVVPDDAALKSEFRPDLLGGVEVVTGEVQAIVRGEDGAAKVVPHTLVAIPYYSWANRGMGEMTVWIARTPEVARTTPVLPEPIAKVSQFSGIEKAWTGYGDQNDDICAVYDGVDPLSSFDESHLYFRMRPPEKKSAWIQYDFKVMTEVSSSQIYFADDTRFCRLPLSWRILYKDGNAWKPVENAGPYTVYKDKFNEVSFKPVKTSAIRIEVEPQNILYKAGAAGPPWATTIREDTIWREFGIIEWRVN